MSFLEELEKSLNETSVKKKTQKKIANDTPSKQKVIKNKQEVPTYYEWLQWLKDNKDKYPTQRLQKLYYNCVDAPKKHWQQVAIDVITSLQLMVKEVKV